MPDLILLDYMMPDMDGAHVLREIRSNDAIKDIPVIFLTVSDERETVLQCLNLNPRAYLIKPIVKSKLLTEVEKCFSSP